MIKTKSGIYIDSKDIKLTFKIMDIFYVPLIIKNYLYDLYKYYESFLEKDKTIILLGTGTVLENFYLAVIDKNIVRERRFDFKPSLILLWNECTEKVILRR